MKKAKKEFRVRSDQILEDCRRGLKVLKKWKRAGEITRGEFREAKRKLAREVDRKNWENFKKLWLG